MTVVGAGASCVRWGYPGLLGILASWFASPLLAGFLSAVLLVCIRKGVLEVQHLLAHQLFRVRPADRFMSLEDSYMHLALPHIMLA